MYADSSPQKKKGDMKTAIIAAIVAVALVFAMPYGQFVGKGGEICTMYMPIDGVNGKQNWCVSKTYEVRKPLPIQPPAYPQPPPRIDPPRWPRPEPLTRALRR